MSTVIPLNEMVDRYKKLYVPAVADVLDSLGLWHQVMDAEIKPLRLTDKIAGVAFTALGRSERSEDRSIRLGAKMVDHLSPHDIAVFDCADDRTVGHWGELLSNGAIARGATGAVVDGGMRDTAAVLDLEFPVFHRFRLPRDAKGRWNVVDMQQRVVCGGVPVSPGDFIVGDCDGVVVVPRELATEVLIESETTVKVESEIRDRVRAGENVGDLYMTYDRF
jgi:regulator of RNase E activity RraA